MLLFLSKQFYYIAINISELLNEDFRWGKGKLFADQSL